MGKKSVKKQRLDNGAAAEVPADKSDASEPELEKGEYDDDEEEDTPAVTFAAGAAGRKPDVLTVKELIDGLASSIHDVVVNSM